MKVVIRSCIRYTFQLYQRKRCLDFILTENDSILLALNRHWIKLNAQTQFLEQNMLAVKICRFRGKQIEISYLNSSPCPSYCVVTYRGWIRTYIMHVSVGTASSAGDQIIRLSGGAAADKMPHSGLFLVESRVVLILGFLLLTWWW